MERYVFHVTSEDKQERVPACRKYVIGFYNTNLILETLEDPTEPLQMELKSGMVAPAFNLKRQAELYEFWYSLFYTARQPMLLSENVPNPPPSPNMCI